MRGLAPFALAVAVLLGQAAAAQTTQRRPRQAPPPRAAAQADSGPVRAMLNNPPVVSLPDAEARLVQSNLTVQAARLGVDAARAQRMVASSLPPPSVSIGNIFGQVNERSNGTLAGWQWLSPNNNINLGFTALIERGGKRELRTRAAESQIGVAEAQVLDALRTQVYQLRQAYIQGLAARANLEVALANRASLDRTEALLQRQVQEGAIPEGDLIRFQASRLAFEQDVTTNAQAYAVAVATVAVFLAEDAAAFAERQRRTHSPVAFDLRGRLDSAQPLGIARGEFAEATANRPDVVAAQRQAEAAQANRELAEAGRSRDVTLGLGVGRTRLSQNVPDGFVANSQATFQLSVPIFQRRIVEGTIGVATAQAAQAEALARLASVQARSDFAAAWAAMEQARALRNLYDGGALRRAQEAYEIAERAYLAGGRSLIDTLDALRTLNATRIQANQARAAYLLALAQLEQATGVVGVMPRL